MNKELDPAEPVEDVELNYEPEPTPQELEDQKKADAAEPETYTNYPQGPGEEPIGRPEVVVDDKEKGK